MTIGKNEPTTPAPTAAGSDGLRPIQPSIVQVEAAKLRLVTDRRLGKQSPAWLQRVAQGLPPQGAAATG